MNTDERYEGQEYEGQEYEGQEHEQKEKGDFYSDRVSFNILDKSQMLLEILGCYHMYDHIYKDPPAPLKKGEKVRLISGKFPLHDYKDCSGYANHVYTFEKEDTSRFTGTLSGFTYDCTYDCEKDLGIPQFDIILKREVKDLKD